MLQINGYPCEGEFVKLDNGDKQRVSEYLKNYNGDLKLAIQALAEENHAHQTHVSIILDHDDKDFSDQILGARVVLREPV